MSFSKKVCCAIISFDHWYVCSDGPGSLPTAIDHLHALLAERDALKERLNTARAALSPGHPALQIAPKNLSDDKVPLWEREWNGGNGWNDDAGDDE